MLAVTEALDSYWAEELGCTGDALYRGGITLCAPRHREGPRWMGWLVPLECIVLDQAIPDTGVISVTPRLLAPLRKFLAAPLSPGEYLPPLGKALFSFAHEVLPNGFPKIHRILHCDAATFTPAPEVFPVEMLDPDDIHAGWYHMHFDGPVFVARNAQGSIASWAAIKCKADAVWEMAVVTEAPYRGRGLARSVVSRATQAALDAGKAPLYLHEISNHASARVAQSLGYRHYGHELTCEAGRVMPTRR